EKKPTPPPEVVAQHTPGGTAERTAQKPQKGRLPLGRATFITDQDDSVRPLAAYLEQKGAEVLVIATTRFDELSASRQEVVIIGADTEATWTSLSKTMLNRLFGNTKIIAFGKGGAALFRQLGLKISA